MNLTETESCVVTVVGGLVIFVPAVFICAVLLAIAVVVISISLTNVKCKCLRPYCDTNRHNFISLLLIIAILVLTSVSIFDTANVVENIKFEKSNDLYLILAWCLLFVLILLDIMRVIPRITVTSCNLFHVGLLIILTIPFGQDIYFVQYWYKQCLYTENRLLYGICLQLRLVITLILGAIQLIFARERNHNQSDLPLVEICYWSKNHSELNVWLPADSGGLVKFFNALNAKLAKDGIRLKKIDKDEIKDVDHVIAVCNCCTRINSDIKAISGLEPHLRQKISILLIVYFSRAPYHSGNVRHAKVECQGIKDIVEMFFTTQLGNKGITDEPENSKALETITKSANPLNN